METKIFKKSIWFSVLILTQSIWNCFAENGNTEDQPTNQKIYTDYTTEAIGPPAALPTSFTDQPGSSFGPPSGGPPAQTTGSSSALTYSGSTSLYESTPVGPHGETTQFVKSAGSSVGQSASTRVYGPPSFGPLTQTKYYGPPSFGPIGQRVTPNGASANYNNTSPNTKTDEFTTRLADNQSGDNGNTTPALPPDFITNSYQYNFWINDPKLFEDGFSPIEYISTICPSSGSCQNNESQTNNNEEYVGCCIKCECSDDCFVKGTCCHDKTVPSYLSSQTVPLSKQNEECVYPTLGGSSIKELVRVGAKSSLMIARCHGGGTHDNLKSLCENLEYTAVQRLLELSPMYSATKDVHYLNKFCATCNSETSQLVPWSTIILKCMSLFSNSLRNIKSLYNFINIIKESSCVLNFAPPTNNVTDCYHQDAIVSTCPNDVSTPVDNKIKEYCENISAPYGMRPQIYKNVFCFGCNYLQSYIFNTACEYSYLLNGPTSEAELDITVLEEGLLKGSEDTSGMDMQVNGTCGNGSVYNQHLDRCTTSVCAPSKVRVNGTCQRLFKVLINIALDYKVTYRFLVNSRSSQGSKYSKLTENAIFGENHYYSYEICDGKSETQASLKDFHITITDTVRREIKEMTDVEEEFNFFKTRLKPLLNSEDNLETNLDNGGYKAIDIGEVEFVRFDKDPTKNDFSNCPESIAMVDLQFCDAIVFPLEGTMVNGIALEVSSITFKPSEYLIRTNTMDSKIQLYAQVCKDLLEEKIAAARETYTATINDSNWLHSGACALKILIIVFVNTCKYAYLRTNII